MKGTFPNRGTDEGVQPLDPQVKIQLGSTNVLLGSHVPGTVSGPEGLQDTVLNQREQRGQVFHLPPSPHVIH